MGDHFQPGLNSKYFFSLKFQTPLISLQFAQLINYAGAVLFQNYINCYYGNEVMLQSDSIASAAYVSGWQFSQDRNSRIKPYLLILMQRARRPMALTIGKFSNLNLGTFLSVGKASFSYYTFLVNIQSKSK